MKTVGLDSRGQALQTEPASAGLAAAADSSGFPEDDAISRLFAADGPLARAIPGYRVRTQQVEMARAVSEAIEQRSVLIAEAGTGTGKTCAYLVPALLSGGKVIVSTGTKTLQDQLFDRDIPTVRRALQAPVTVALLKGRANYVCHYHLERNLADARLASREDAGHMQAIARFARTTRSGDRASVAEVPEDSPVWPLVTSTRENCLGSECPRHQECFVLEARRQALAADVVVVNHHLFFADLVLRDEGVSELLPACNTVIFDEAHQLPDTATLFFGESVSTGQMIELARDTRVEAAAGAKDFAALPDAAQALDRAARDLRIAAGDDVGRLPARQAEARREFSLRLEALGERLAALAGVLELQAERSEGLHSCWQRSLDLAGRLERWRTQNQTQTVRWVEVFAQTLALNATPLSTAEIFRKQVLASARAWIFTSATLSVRQDFSHYRQLMGLAEARTASWDSPFDYPAQAVLYVPRGMPGPNAAGYTQAVVEAVLPVLAASRGRAFLLFTSLRAMREAHRLLQERLAQEGLDFPLLLQGEGARSELLERFRRLGNAVLVASQSFWEGVDVRGEALSLVMIDRLPFAPPDDPVLEARIERMTAEGRNAFMEYQVPQAVITLKQGAGRLIRDETDRGVLMICDTRMVDKPYGRRIWQSLPAFRRTRELEEVVAFFLGEQRDREA
jgi:ATP-dependent DNA helicase DinG